MTKRNKVYSVPARISIRAFNDQDAIKQANDAIADGLIDPGFIEDGAVAIGEEIGRGQIFELDTLEE